MYTAVYSSFVQSQRDMTGTVHFEKFSMVGVWLISTESGEFPEQIELTQASSTLGLFSRQGSLCIPGHPGTCSVDQGGLNLRDLSLPPKTWNTNFVNLKIVM